MNANTATFLETLGHLWLTQQILLAVLQVEILFPLLEVIASPSPQIQEQFKR